MDNFRFIWHDLTDNTPWPQQVSSGVAFLNLFIALYNLRLARLLRKEAVTVTGVAEVVETDGIKRLRLRVLAANTGPVPVTITDLGIETSIVGKIFAPKWKNFDPELPAPLKQGEPAVLDYFGDQIDTEQELLMAKTVIAITTTGSIFRGKIKGLDVWKVGKPKP